MHRFVIQEYDIAVLWLDTPSTKQTIKLPSSKHTSPPKYFLLPLNPPPRYLVHCRHYQACYIAGEAAEAVHGDRLGQHRQARNCDANCFDGGAERGPAPCPCSWRARCLLCRAPALMPALLHCAHCSSCSLSSWPLQINTLDYVSDSKCFDLYITKKSIWPWNQESKFNQTTMMCAGAQTLPCRT